MLVTLARLKLLIYINKSSRRSPGGAIHQYLMANDRFRFVTE